MIRLGRDIVRVRNAYMDRLFVRNDDRGGIFEGSVTILKVTGAAYYQTVQTYPLTWTGGTPRLEIRRNMSASIDLCEYYQPLIQSDEWMLGLLGWDFRGLIPAHYANDPSGVFSLGIKVWRSHLLSDILHWSVLDETVSVSARLRSTHCDYSPA